MYIAERTESFQRLSGKVYDVIIKRHDGGRVVEIGTRQDNFHNYPK
jgi:hypothetical protein